MLFFFLIILIVTFPQILESVELSLYSLKQFPGLAHLFPNPYQQLRSSNISFGVKSLHRTSTEVKQNLRMCGPLGFKRSNSFL